MIFKMQLSFPDAESVLIYDKGRNWLGQLDVTEDIKALFDDDVVCYVEGKVLPNGVLSISHRVEDSF